MAVGYISLFNEGIQYGWVVPLWDVIFFKSTPYFCCNEEHLCSFLLYSIQYKQLLISFICFSENPEIVPRTPCEVCGKLVMTENYKSHYKYAHGKFNYLLEIYFYSTGVNCQDVFILHLHDSPSRMAYF